MGTKWKQSGNKAGTRTPKWGKIGNKAGTKWKQEPQSGARMGTKWKQSGNKAGTRTPKWGKIGNKAGTKWKQEPQSGARMGQEPQSGARMGTKWEQVGTRTPKWGKNGNKIKPAGMLDISLTRIFLVDHMVFMWSLSCCFRHRSQPCDQGPSFGRAMLLHQPHLVIRSYCWHNQLQDAVYGKTICNRHEVLDRSLFIFHLQIATLQVISKTQTMSLGRGRHISQLQKLHWYSLKTLGVVTLAISFAFGVWSGSFVCVLTIRWLQRACSDGR